MLRRSWLLLSFLISWSISYGQIAESDNDSAFKTIQLPMFDLGFGWSFLMGDVGNTSPAPSPALQLSYGLSIRQAIMPYLSVSIDFSSGKFYGEKALGDSGNINYKTSVINQGLRFTYEASHLFRKNDKGFAQYQPYIGVGVGLISFRAKGDLKDGNSNTYHYWSDGTIRSLPESANNIDLAEVISRDMIYESDLRDANLDGFGRYDQMALRVPIELGFRYQFTKRIGAHIKGVYNLNFTDLLDNVTSESLGDRQANSANDNHLTAMVGVSVYLGEYRKPKRKKKIREPKPALIAVDDTNMLDEDEASNHDSTSSLANSAIDNENQVVDNEEESEENSISTEKLDSDGNSLADSGVSKIENEDSIDSSLDKNESASSENVNEDKLKESTLDNSTSKSSEDESLTQDSDSNQAGVTVINENPGANNAEIAVENSNSSENVDSDSNALNPTKANDAENEGQINSPSADNESTKTEKESEDDLGEISSDNTPIEPIDSNSSQSNNTESQNSLGTNSNSTEESDQIASSEQSVVEDSNSKNADKSTSTSSKDNALESAENLSDKSTEEEIIKSEMTTMDLIDKTMDIKSTEPKIAGSYHWADVDKDKYISADEVLHFIDLLFDGESKYTVPMIHELIEYYFDQD